jgi:putative phage-type endonuclease
MEQRTEAWFADRLGKVTASRVADVIAKTKSGYSATRANYMAQLICERLTGKQAESYTNSDMERGVELEPIARAMYEMHTDLTVSEVGFILHPKIDMTGASPDGLVDDGLIEIKCPRSGSHLEYVLAGVVPEKYKPQMAWQCLCTERNWCDFVSYNQDFPEHLQLFVVRFTPDKEYLNMLQDEVKKFLNELESKLKQLEKL